jgi:stage II sporulation protein D
MRAFHYENAILSSELKLKRTRSSSRINLQIPGLYFLLICTCLLCSCSSLQGEKKEHIQARVTINEDELDSALHRAATIALGEREGAILVMDPRNGRLRAVVNPRLAFEQAFPPGSAIKPFTMLAAIEAGLIDGESRRKCCARYARGGFEIVCSHPKSEAPLSPAQALAYSCNYFFAALGERLNPSVLIRILSLFGFGVRTGVNVGGESAGRLASGEWQVKDLLGEGDHLLVTPIQLLTAYVALVSGHLYRPQLASSHAAPLQERTSINMADVNRAVLIEGMRGAIKFGTAARASLDSLPLYLFGKTGTSTASNGFRTQAWFVGFAADPHQGEDVPNPRLLLAVLVFLKRAHSGEAALVARPVFEEFAKRYDSYVADEKPAPEFKVHLVREDKTIEITLEDYVLGVLAAESSVEDEVESLKAQAVVNRTFALKNRGRHAGEGFDFCSTTHCQRFVGPSAARAIARKAVMATRGQVLCDGRGELADVYFHAACGGMTASIAALWGVPAPEYLRGVRDDYCATMPHRNWVELIPIGQLSKALSSDPRSDVGKRLRSLSVVKRDATGRAELILLKGERSRFVRGWDFKLIVGRALGWNVLKSSRFEVEQAAGGFVFRGSGFGHGLGLCQEGAHVMAHRGASYQQILDHYFPSTAIKNGDESRACNLKRDPMAEGWQFCHCAFIPEPQPAGRLTLSSEHFRVSYPTSSRRRDVERVIDLLEEARAECLRRLTAGLGEQVEANVIDVIIHETTQQFVRATGQPWWVAGVASASRIQLQPLAVLNRRGLLTKTLRHEYAHVVVAALSKGQAPRWLAEGLAVHFAGEGGMLARFMPKANWPLDEIEQRLAHPASPQDMRKSLAAAYAAVNALIRAEGERSVWQKVALGSGNTNPNASPLANCATGHANALIDHC